MEVHAHTHTARKKWTHYFWEFLMLFLAVSLGFYAENIREGMIHKKQVRTDMQSLLADVHNDLVLFDSVMQRNTYAATMSDSLIWLLRNDISNTPEIYFAARAVTANIGYCYTNSKSFDQMKSSGILRFVHPHNLLDSIGTYYVAFEWLREQTDMLKLKLDAIHKGNSVLFDSYTFSKMMSSSTAYYRSFNGGISLVGHPEGRPPLLSDNARDINNVSLNYHYYSATARFYVRIISLLRVKALQLIESIKNEYGFE